ncbi:MAG: ABC transporter permease [Gammaproteobacteria bacterium]|nr:ABC transporter permease [Gammaproteobacteria bacterium]
MIQRILAILHARNLEFLRDKATLGWNVAMPLLLVAGMAAIFSGGDRAAYKVGLVQAEQEINTAAHPFLETRYFDFIAMDQEQAIEQVANHQLDLALNMDSGTYWINPESPGGYFAERMLEASSRESEWLRQPASGDPITYVDWLVPGILGMNIMFSCLFGVGYVVVRYRKNGFLKRLKATPLRPVEFLSAQIISRLMLAIFVTLLLYGATRLLLDIRMEGSGLALFLVAVLASISLVSIGLAMAARVTSEELAGGLLNMVTWPMMLLSGVWFSLAGAPGWVQQLSNIFPLTHALTAAREIMLYGAGVMDVLPQLLILTGITAAFLTIGATMFRWRGA